MNSILITTSTFAQFDNRPLEMIQKAGYSYVLNEYKRKLSENEILSLIEKIQPVGLIAGVEPITPRVLEKAKNLKAISRCGIGMDSIDIEAASKHAIQVINTPDAPTIAVAELTLGLILAALRNISFIHSNIQKKKWLRPMGHLISDKTVGIIGCGRIGSYLARLLSSFNCTVLGYDIRNNKNDNYVWVELDELYKRSDIITIHIPYTRSKEHFINRNTFSCIKKGAILINTSRGGLIDEDVLYEMLQSKYLGGAAIDCFEHEPYTGRLIELDNIILTSHIGSYAVESRIMMEKQSVDNLLQLLGA